MSIIDGAVYRGVKPPQNFRSILEFSLCMSHVSCFLQSQPTNAACLENLGGGGAQSTTDHGTAKEDPSPSENRSSEQERSSDRLTCCFWTKSSL